MFVVFCTNERMCIYLNKLIKNIILGLVTSLFEFLSVFVFVIKFLQHFEMTVKFYEFVCYNLGIIMKTKSRCQDSNVDKINSRGSEPDGNL